MVIGLATELTVIPSPTTIFVTVGPETIAWPEATVGFVSTFCFAFIAAMTFAPFTVRVGHDTVPMKKLGFQDAISVSGYPSHLFRQPAKCS